MDFSLRPLTLVLSLDTTEESLAPFTLRLHPPLGYLYVLIRVSLNLLFFTVNGPNSRSLSSQQKYSRPQSSSWPSPGPPPVAPCPSRTKELFYVSEEKPPRSPVTGRPSHPPRHPRGAAPPPAGRRCLTAPAAAAAAAPSPGSAALAPLAHGKRRRGSRGRGAAAAQGRGRDPGRAARPASRASNKMALSASAPPPRARAEGWRRRRGPAPRERGLPGPSVRPAGAERSRGHSPPARGAEAPRPSHAACLSRAPPHIERGRNAAGSSAAAAATTSSATSSSSSAAGPAAPPPPELPRAPLPPLFICGFSALQNGAQGGNERPPRPAGCGCARTRPGPARREALRRCRARRGFLGPDTSARLRCGRPR